MSYYRKTKNKKNTSSNSSNNINKMDKIVRMLKELQLIYEVKLLLKVMKRGIDSTCILNKSNSFLIELVMLMNRKNQIKPKMKKLRQRILSIKLKKESKCWSKPIKKRNISSKKSFPFSIQRTISSLKRLQTYLINSRVKTLIKSQLTKNQRKTQRMLRLNHLKINNNLQMDLKSNLNSSSNTSITLPS